MRVLPPPYLLLDSNAHQVASNLSTAPDLVCTANAALKYYSGATIASDVFTAPLAGVRAVFKCALISA